MQAVLTELARVRLHGFSERELRQAKLNMLSEVESAFIEKDQDYSTVGPWVCMHSGNCSLHGDMLRLRKAV